MDSSKGKICPILSEEFYDYCTGEKCAWWCDFAQGCAVPALTSMFADSEICRTVFHTITSKD